MPMLTNDTGRETQKLCKSLLQERIGICMINLGLNLASFSQRTIACFGSICELAVLQHPLLNPTHHVGLEVPLPTTGSCGHCKDTHGVPLNSSPGSRARLCQAPSPALSLQGRNAFSSELCSLTRNSMSSLSAHRAS